MKTLPYHRRGRRVLAKSGLKFRLAVYDLTTMMSSQGHIDDHQSGEDLENYSLGRLAASRMPEVEQHLLVCEQCRTKLSDIEPYNSVHYTRDGPFYSRVTKLRTGALFARYWGRSLEVGKEFQTHQGARAYPARTFSQMFPHHICTAHCGATDPI
jgi:hypothetical protein